MTEVALMAEVAENTPPLPPFRHMLDLLIFTLQVTITEMSSLTLWITILCLQILLNAKSVWQNFINP